MIPPVRAVLLAWPAGGGAMRAPDDPFAPVAQDPDVARDVACGLTAADDVCFPPEPDPIEPPPRFTPSGDGGGVWFGNLLVVLLVVALVVLIVWLVITILRNRAAADGDDGDEDLDVDLDEPVERRHVDHRRPPDMWRDAAAEHRAAGRHRDAIRCEYRALVGDLARAGILDEIPGRTSGEERWQLAELAPEVSADFDTAAGLFDEAWFSDAEVDGADDERFVAAARAVLDAVLSGARRERGRR